MCEPLTIASLALSGGSVLAGMAGNAEQQAARDKAISGEATRSQIYEGQANDRFQQSLSKAQKPTYDKNVTEEAAKRTAADGSLIDAAGNFTPVTGSGPQEVGQTIARAGQNAISRGKQQAKLNADVGATSTVNQKLGIDLGRDGEWQNIFGGNIRRSAALLPGELADANKAGSGWRGVSSIMSAGAGAAGSVGGAAGAPTWGSVFGSSTPVVGSSPAGMAVPQGARQQGIFSRMFGS
jgi:hypothetical protein